MITALLCSVSSHASNIISLKPLGVNRLTVIENSVSRLRVSNLLSSFNSQILYTQKGEFAVLSADSYSKSNVIGAPQLPEISRLIQIPQNSDAQVKVISYDVKEYHLAGFGITQPLLPAQPSQPKNDQPNPEFVQNELIYKNNAFYGESLARIEVTGEMRGVKVASLILSPVVYNPVTNCIRVYDNLLVEVSFSGATSLKSADIRSGTQSVYFRNVFSHLLNAMPETETAAATPGIPVKYIIVSDPMFREALQPFVNWKTRRGFNVIQAYTDNPDVGTTTTSIKSYLKNLYTSATPTDPAPTFVLFVGDIQQIPSFQCVGHVSDLYYCEYTGDYLPEVFYGRFSANTVNELLPQINKTLQYEQYLMPDPSYLDNAVLIAGADAAHQLDWGNGQVNYATEYYFNASHNLKTHTYLQPEPGGSYYSQNIRANISQGVCFASYSAHGNVEGWINPAFSISDVSLLQNQGKYGLMIGNSCQTSAFNLNSFGEALVRAENKGALAYIGATDLTYWDEDYWWSVGNGAVTTHPTYETTGLGSLDRLFHDHNEQRADWCSTMGQMVFAGNMAVQESNSGLKQYYWEVYCLLGDPSTMNYFSKPQAMTATHEPLLVMGMSDFEIHTEAFASVAISKNNTLYGVAETDENGLAKVPLKPFTEPGYATIVVTKQNRIPLTDSVLVSTPEADYITLKSSAIYDAAGNNNQLPEAGEEISLDLTLNNVGKSYAIYVESTLSTNDTYLTIPATTYHWPHIPGQSSAAAHNVFNLHIAGNVPDLHKAVLSVTTQTYTGKFSSEISFTVYAPCLQNGVITFNDTLGGNGNGQIEPGETIFFTLPVTNTGHYVSTEVVTRLFVSGGQVSTTSQALNLGVLPPGETKTAIFSFTVDPDAVVGSDFSLFVSTIAGAYNTATALSVQVGSRVEDFETGDFTKFNWKMNGNSPWIICKDEKMEGSFAARSGLLGNSEKSEIYFDGMVLFPDTISFYRKVASENGYDFLKFLIDGQITGQWSGNMGWAEVKFPIPAGSHRLSWMYEKDEATTTGIDAAWIDNIKLPAFITNRPRELGVTVFAVPAAVCKNEPVHVYAFATGSYHDYTCKWSPAEAFSDSTAFFTTVIPSETTSYKLLISNGSQTFDTTFKVEVEPLPETPLVSISGDRLISSAETGNQWYNSEGAISGANAQTFTPSVSDLYFVTANNSSGCTSKPSDPFDFVLTGTKATSENNFSVFPNPFTGMVTLYFRAKTTRTVRVEIVDMIGSKVAQIEGDNLASGSQMIIFNGSKLSPGMYVFRLYDKDGVQSVKASRVK